MRFSPYKDCNSPGFDGNVRLGSPAQWRGGSAELVDGDEASVVSFEDSEEEEYPVSLRADEILALEPDYDDAWREFERQTARLALDTARLKNKEYQQHRRKDSLFRHSQRDLYTEQDKSLHESQAIRQQLELGDTDIKEQPEAWDSKSFWDGINGAIAKAEELGKRRQEEIRRVEEERVRKEQEAQRKKEEERIRAEKEQRERQDRERQAREKADREAKEKQEKLVADQKAASEADRKDQQEKLDKDKPSSEAAYYADHIRRIKEDVLQPVSADKALKQACFSSKRKITPKIGQLTNSVSQIKRVIDDLEAVFLMGKQHSEIVYTWILNFFSKAVVKQAEAEVIVAPKTAYPLAMVCVVLMERHKALTDTLMARFAKNCPWMIPFVEYSMDTEQGRKSLGFKRTSEGRWEEGSSYTERQSGIFAVYAAIVQSQPAHNSYGMEHAWIVLSRLINRTRPLELLNSGQAELAQTVCAIAATFCDVCGPAFLEKYRGQATKMLRCLFSVDWLGQSGGGSNFVRLRLMGEKFIANGQLGLADVSFDS